MRLSRLTLLRDPRATRKYCRLIARTRNTTIDLRVWKLIARKSVLRYSLSHDDRYTNPVHKYTGMITQMYKRDYPRLVSPI